MFSSFPKGDLRLALRWAFARFLLMPFARAFLGDSPDCVGALVEPHLLQLPGSADLPMEWPWEMEHA